MVSLNLSRYLPKNNLNRTESKTGIPVTITYGSGYHLEHLKK